MLSDYFVVLIIENSNRNRNSKKKKVLPCYVIKVDHRCKTVDKHFTHISVSLSHSVAGKLSCLPVGGELKRCSRACCLRGLI